jgi:hypothetical protein
MAVADLAQSITSDRRQPARVAHDPCGVERARQRTGIGSGNRLRPQAIAEVLGLPSAFVRKIDANAPANRPSAVNCVAP